uniref:Putative secreted protein n=1 Tax=Anopheles darlingi TaxID=43151 RepID=A0A2M4DDY5_ANODA
MIYIACALALASVYLSEVLSRRPLPPHVPATTTTRYTGRHSNDDITSQEHALRNSKFRRTFLSGLSHTRRLAEIERTRTMTPTSHARCVYKILKKTFAFFPLE